MFGPPNDPPRGGLIRAAKEAGTDRHRNGQTHRWAAAGPSPDGRLSSSQGRRPATRLPRGPADHLRVRAGRPGPLAQAVHGARRVLRAEDGRGPHGGAVPGGRGPGLRPDHARIPHHRGDGPDRPAAAASGGGAPAPRPPVLRATMPGDALGSVVLDIDHVGIAVRDLEAAVEEYRASLGVEPVHRERVEDQGVEEVLFPVGTSYVQLLAATGPDTPVGRFLERRGEGVHHIGYRVRDVTAVLDALRAAGVPLVDERPRPGSRGTIVAFVHPKGFAGVL